MKTLIVASGDTLLDNKNGDVIDTFDHVIRFKGFEKGIFENEDRVGSKVDYISFNTNIHTLRDMKKKTDQNYFSNEFGSVRFLMTWTYKSSLRRGLRMLKGKMGDQFETVNYNRVKKHVYRCNRKNSLGMHKQNDFSSGLIIVSHCIMDDRYQNVYVTGFDSLTETGDTGLHYYDDSASDNTLDRIHDLENEAKVIQHWIDEGIINHL
jgi:hypothetical protein